MRIRVESPGAPAFDTELVPPEVIVGRANTAGIVIDNRSVSRHHARFTRRGHSWWLEDLGATNPTIYNGHPLQAPVALAGGDAIRIGDSVLTVVDEAKPTAASPAAEGTPSAAGTKAGARLDILNDVHRALATPISLAALLDLILERSFDVLSPEEGVILLRDPASGEMRRAASRAASGDGREVFVSRRIVDEVAGKSKPALVLDAAVDERFAGSDSIIMAGVRSVLAAPLVDGTGTLGLIALCSRASVRQFSNDDLDLLVSLASAAALRVRNVALMEEAAARRVLEHELAIAHEMQMAMLPREIPARPEIAVAAALQPARSVGGDLYDFVVDGDRLWFIIADVAGKSVAAALYMAVAKTLFRAMATGGAEPADVAARMNRELARDNERMVFVTALVACLDLRTGDLTIVDAGHNPSVLIDPHGEMTSPRIPKSIAFGVMDDATFAAAHIALAPGTTIVMYTDGATDARSISGEMFGADRLDAAIRNASALPPDALVPAIASAVNDFAAGAPPEDDLTLLAVCYRGA